MNYLLLETNKVLYFAMMQETCNWYRQLYIDNGTNSCQLVYKALGIGRDWWYYSRAVYFSKNGHDGLVSIYDLQSEIWKYYS